MLTGRFQICILSTFLDFAFSPPAIPLCVLSPRVGSFWAPLSYTPTRSKYSRPTYWIQRRTWWAQTFSSNLVHQFLEETHKHPVNKIRHKTKDTSRMAYRLSNQREYSTQIENRRSLHSHTVLENIEQFLGTLLLVNHKFYLYSTGLNYLFKFFYEVWNCSLFSLKL